MNIQIQNKIESFKKLNSNYQTQINTTNLEIKKLEAYDIQQEQKLKDIDRKNSKIDSFCIDVPKVRRNCNLNDFC